MASNALVEHLFINTNEKKSELTLTLISVFLC